ncbi:replication initiator protein RctB domain-containing protein [Photobacterium toruni]|uniref:replication initiator protein RctB domain-containing protein n=1 Tax=Photobacterium toruni TaxID=1935446 RepID=UPI00210F8B51|nr:replication initiator protein RctB domain-containing protein [Photobacterium toruni]
MILYNLTANDGSMIYYPTDFSITMDQVESFGLSFTKNELVIIDAIIKAYHIIDDNRVVTIKTLDAIYQIPLKYHQINHAIRKLHTMGYLKELSFEFATSGTKRKCKLYELVFSEKKCIVDLVEIKNKQQKHAKNRKLAQVSRRETTQLMDTKGLRKPPSVTSNTQLVKQQVNYPFEQIYAPRGSNKQKLVGYVWGKNKQGDSVSVPCQVSSTSRVVTDDDILTYYSLISLTYTYHLQWRNSYLASNEIPVNKTPVMIADIIKMRGISEGEPSRKRIRESMEALHRTEYDFGAIMPIEWEGQDFYKISNFRILQLESYSTIQPKIINGEFVTNINAWTIKWPDAFFKAIFFNNESAWVFPRYLLSLDPLLCLLYLHCRANYQKQKLSMDLEHLRKRIARNEGYDNFRKRLLRSLKQAKTKTHCTPEYIEGDRKNLYYVKLNLFGYNVKIDFNEDYISITKNERAFLEALNVNNFSKPTIRNEMKELEIYKTLNLSDNPKRQEKVVNVTETPFIRSIDGIHVVKLRFITRVKLSQAMTVNVSRYTRDEILVQYARDYIQLSQDAILVDKVIQYLKQLRDHTPYVGIDEHVVTLDTMTLLYERISVHVDISEISDLVQVMTRRKPLIVEMLLSQEHHEEYVLVSIETKLRKILK